MPDFDPILEAGLSEVIGQQSPPDLSARILQAVAARQLARQQMVDHIPLASNGHSVVNNGVVNNGVVNHGVVKNGAASRLLPPQAGPVAPLNRLPIAEPVLVSPQASLDQYKSQPRPLSYYMSWAAVAAAVLLVVVLGWKPLTNSTSVPIVKHPAPQVPSTPQNRPAPTPRVDPQLAVERPAPPVVPSSPVVDEPEVVQHNPSVSTQSNNLPATPSVLGSVGPLVFAEPSSDADIIAFVNHEIAQGWAEAGINCSPEATEEEWCRRVYLDLLGRIPTYEELLSFVQEVSPDKKAQLVDRLLGSKYYDVDYARNWTSIWTNLLIGRSGGMDPTRPVNRAGLQAWLRQQFLTNRPYDEMVRELVSAEGANTPDEPNFNGAVNFLLDNLQADQVPVTNKVSELFLGRRISCTQCHSHPFNDWTQQSFWELNAFFKQARARRAIDDGNSTKGPQFARLVDEDFAGESRSPTPHEAEIYYELRNGMWKVAYPKFEGRSIERSGFVNVTHRRRALAALLTRSVDFRKAAVNRMWEHFFGYGFSHPVEDMGPHNLPSHPEILNRLAEEFAAGGYNLKSLLRWLVLSKPYSLSSRMVKGPQGNEADDPEKIDISRGGRLLFSRFYSRQMQAEELYESLRVAQTGYVPDDQKVQQDKHQWVQQFVVTFETDDNCESSSFDGTYPQRLMMLNGRLVKQAVHGDSMQSLLNDKKLPPVAKMERLSLSALRRKPQPVELAFLQKTLPSYRGDTSAWLEDVYWTLLNSPEFIIQH